jgi:hypothetical protein
MDGVRVITHMVLQSERTTSKTITSAEMLKVYHSVAVGLTQSTKTISGLREISRLLMTKNGTW